MRKEIFIIRHGETDLNRQGIVQGRGVNSPLNERGAQQAFAFFNHFGNENFEVIFTSTLLRTQQTVQPFIDSGHKILPFPELDEISWGIYEGKIQDTMNSVSYREMLESWRQGKLDACAPEGESPLDLQKRQRVFIEKVLKPAPQKKILICSHGRAMRSLLCTMLNVDLSKMDDFPHQNLSLYKVIYNSHGFELEWLNYLEHLR